MEVIVPLLSASFNPIQTNIETQMEFKITPALAMPPSSSRPSMVSAGVWDCPSMSSLFTVVVPWPVPSRWQWLISFPISSDVWIVSLTYSWALHMTALGNKSTSCTSLIPTLLLVTWKKKKSSFKHTSTWAQGDPSNSGDCLVAVGIVWSYAL